MSKKITGGHSADGPVDSMRKSPKISRKEADQITELTIENTRLREELEETLNLLNDRQKKASSDLVAAADDMLRFLAGLNLQDHPIQEQRDFNAKFRTLKEALKKEKES